MVPWFKVSVFSFGFDCVKFVFFILVSANDLMYIERFIGFSISIELCKSMRIVIEKGLVVV